LIFPHQERVFPLSKVRKFEAKEEARLLTCEMCEQMVSDELRRLVASMAVEDAHKNATKCRTSFDVEAVFVLLVRLYRGHGELAIAMLPYVLRIKRNLSAFVTSPLSATASTNPLP
jgi:hypothetical protein